MSPRSAPDAVKEMLEAGLLDGVTDNVDRDRLALTGQGGFLSKLVKTCPATEPDRLSRVWCRRARGGSAVWTRTSLSLYVGGDGRARYSASPAAQLELSHEKIDIQDHRHGAGEVTVRQSRLLEEIYPVIYLDALVMKVRDGHQGPQPLCSHRRRCRSRRHNAAVNIRLSRLGRSWHRSARAIRSATPTPESG